MMTMMTTTTLKIAIIIAVEPSETPYILADWRFFRRCGVENFEHRSRKIRLTWFGHVKQSDENSILRRAMVLEVEGRRPVGRPKNTWSKVVEEDMRKLNITEDMMGDIHQWRRLISHPTPGEGN